MSLTRAAVPLLMKREDGTQVEYRLTPFSKKDIEELNEWIRTRYIRIARASLKDDDTEDVKVRVEKLAIEEASTLTCLSGRGVKMISSIEGLARIFWQAARKEHGALDYDELRELLFDPENTRELNRFTSRMSGKEDARPPGKPKQRRRQRRRSSRR